MSDNATSLSHLTNIVSSRSKAYGLNLSQKQAFNVPQGLKSEYLVLPSTSAPAFGSFYIFDIKDKKNSDLKEQTKAFICSNFTIECVAFEDGINVQLKETEYIQEFKPCLNDKKKSR